MSVSVRPGRLSDLATLITLEQGFEPGERVSPRSWRRFLSQPGKVFVLGPNDSVAAVAIVLSRKGSRRARLYSLITDPAYRGQGMASTLLAEVESDLLVRGHDSLSLEVRSDNFGAIALYTRLGFQAYGQKPGYYSDGTKALLMEKALVVREGPE